MFRHVLLGGALSAIVAGTFFPAAPAQASPICVEGSFSAPMPRTIPRTCRNEYPLETMCSTQNFNFGAVLNGYLILCLPSPEVMPVP